MKIQSLLLITWGMLFSTATLYAQTYAFERVTDIHPSGNSEPAYMTVFDDKLYFNAGDGSDGYELWVSDGTAAGTQILKDISPGALDGDPEDFIEYKGKLYFTAQDGTLGRELWVTDGTPEQTHYVVDIHPSAGSSPFHFTLFKDKLFFTATDGAHGREVWMSDGTSANTMLLKDINPGAGNSSSSRSSDKAYFRVYDDKLYFAADDGTTGTELWVSDGTEAGTVKLEPEVATHSTNQVSAPYFTIFHDALYFNARFDDAGEELWKLSPVPASVSELGENKVLVYPNPSSDKVSIEAERRIESLVLYSLAGKRMKALSLSARKAEISLSGLPAGIYFAEVVTSKRKFVRKLIKR